MWRKRFLAAILAIGAAGTVGSVHADTVLYDNSGFIQGPQAFVEDLNITTKGKLTVTLSDIPLGDQISGLSFFLTGNSGAMGTSMGVGTESMEVGPGKIYAHWLGDADGTYGVGVYGLKIDFQAQGGLPVPLPRAILLLASGLTIFLLWPRIRREPSMA